MALVIDPCVPPDWKDFEVKRQWRGATYNITVKNPDGVQKGVKSVTAQWAADLDADTSAEGWVDERCCGDDGVRRSRAAQRHDGKPTSRPG